MPEDLFAIPADVQREMYIRLIRRIGKVGPIDLGIGYDEPLLAWLVEAGYLEPARPDEYPDQVIDGMYVVSIKGMELWNRLVGIPED